MSKIFDVLSYRASKFHAENAHAGPIPPPPPLGGRHLKVREGLSVGLGLR